MVINSFTSGYVGHSSYDRFVVISHIWEYVNFYDHPIIICIPAAFTFYNIITHAINEKKKEDEEDEH